MMRYPVREKATSRRSMREVRRIIDRLAARRAPVTYTERRAIRNMLDARFDAELQYDMSLAATIAVDVMLILSSDRFAAVWAEDKDATA